jgi:hypothetical protein
MFLFDFIPYLVLSVVVIIIIIIVYLFWGYVIVVGDRMAHDKYRIILTIISTIASVVFGSAVVLQVLNFTNQRKTEEIDYYSKLSKEFFDEILLLFLNNMDMSYYYEDLFQISKITGKTKRNLIKEHIISMLIFSKCAKFAIFEFESSNKDAKEKVQKWLGHIFNTMMQSDTLRDYWENEYKPKLSGPATQKYMKLHFNL